MALQTPLRQGKNQSPKPVQPEKPMAPSIFDTIPVSLVLMLAKPYLAGETASQALELAQELYREHSFCSTLDILGEDAASDSDCDASVEHYRQLIELIAKSPLPVSEHRQQPTVSFKPSMFATKTPTVGQVRSVELDRAYDRIEKVVEYAAQRHVNVTLEAEDHRWTDFQLETYFSLIEAGYRNLGTVLQSRLFRTEQDIERFDSRMRTRLVVGIYNEPAGVAHTQKPVMKDLLVKYARRLLTKGTYVEVATHDVRCLETFINNVVIPDKVASNRFETQYLHGVPRKRFQQSLINGQFFSGKDDQFIKKLAESGILVRMYLPFGEGKVAGAYCRRRLKENPNMITYGIKNLLKLDS